MLARANLARRLAAGSLLLLAVLSRWRPEDDTTTNLYGTTSDAIPTVTLNNRVKMPMVSAGFWEVKPTEATELVPTALGLGFDHLDASCVIWVVLEKGVTDIHKNILTNGPTEQKTSGPTN